ncbi:MAG: Type 1 glutamine amidotransferase-like domain-containing protein [Candidatus Rokubacteria bacterium]|nr:Type 1 glutamine amidotransferase-like domain-containing protein [Candidatus Rokubacteria bacterium]
MLEPIRARVRDGLPYVGSSAGSNVACPNILTTNDWNGVALAPSTPSAWSPSTSTLTTWRPTRRWPRGARRATCASPSTMPCTPTR